MAKKPHSPPPPPPSIGPQQAIKRIEARISELEALDPSKLTDFDDPQLQSLRSSILTTLADAFGRGSADYNAFDDAAMFRQSSVIQMGGGWPRGRYGGTSEQQQVQVDVERAKPGNTALLRSAVKLLRERIEDSTLAHVGSGDSSAAPTAALTRVFIVHGHDDGAKQSVARFIEQLGFEAVILHEQANKGRTIIEKILANSDVGFAVVLLTPDDEVHSNGNVTFRARQNVILELGYFIGHLGRDKVCVLKRGDVEEPSDMLGVVWEPLDDRGAWKMALAREMRESGYTIVSIPL